MTSDDRARYMSVRGGVVERDLTAANDEARWEAEKESRLDNRRSPCFPAHRGCRAGFTLRDPHA